MKRKRSKVEELAKLLLILSVRKLSKSGLLRCRGNLLTVDKFGSQQTAHGRNVTEMLRVQISDLRPSRLIFAEGLFRGLFFFNFTLFKKYRNIPQERQWNFMSYLFQLIYHKCLTRDSVESRVSESVVQQIANK